MSSRATSDSPKRSNLGLLDALSGFLIVTSCAALLLLVANIFSGKAAFACGALALSFTLAWKFRQLPMRRSPDLHLVPISALLLLAMIFRFEPYDYIGGYQDPGVYVSMSSHFQAKGTVFVTDEVRRDLPDDLREAYDEDNFGTDVVGERFLPGLYHHDLERSQYVFQFYHLHPLWMAIFADVFGPDYRGYSLVLFSLISIVAFYLVAFELSSSRYIAFISGLLLAFSPLHAFFSKLPVTENQALAFSLLSMLYLLRYWNGARKGAPNASRLAVSALLLGGTFFTRISGFMFLPFFYILLLSSEIFLHDPRLKKQFRTYVLAVFAMYALSVIYGAIFSAPYSSYVYQAAFGKFSKDNWPELLLLAFLAAALFYFLVLFCSTGKYRAYFGALLRTGARALPYLIPVVIAVGLYWVYKLGFTETYSTHAYNTRWKASGTGLSATLYWSVFVLIQYVSPMIFVLFLAAAFSPSLSKKPTHVFLLLFSVIFLVSTGIFGWFVAYQYYYARYLLSETLPALILLATAGTHVERKPNRLKDFLLWIAVGYALLLASTQFMTRELEGFEESLAPVAEHVGPDDILLLDEQLLIVHRDAKTPLRYYFGLNVMSASERNRGRFLDYFCKQDRNIFLLQRTNLNEDAEMVEAIRIETTIFKPSPHIPLDTESFSKDYSLWKASCDDVPRQGS